MSLESTMQSGGAETSGGGSVKSGGNLDTTFDGTSKPSPSASRGMRAPFDKPAARGGIPVKLYEEVSGSPGPLESTLENTGLVR